MINRILHSCKILYLYYNKSQRYLFQISLAWRMYYSRYFAVIQTCYGVGVAWFPITSSWNPARYIRGLIHGIGRGVPNVHDTENISWSIFMLWCQKKTLKYEENIVLEFIHPFSTKMVLMTRFMIYSFFFHKYFAHLWVSYNLCDCLVSKGSFQNLFFFTAAGVKSMCGGPTMYPRTSS